MKNLCFSIRGQDSSESESESGDSSDAKSTRVNLRNRPKIKCPECQRILCTSTQAIDHFHSAHGIKLYPCSVSDCDQIFNRERLLRAHQKDNHQERTQRDHQQTNQAQQIQKEFEPQTRPNETSTVGTKLIDTWHGH